MVGTVSPAPTPARWLTTGLLTVLLAPLALWFSLSYLVRSWFLAPQMPPHGDGFWCGLVRKA